MALAERTARTVWQGDLMKGSGKVSFGTGAISEQAVSFPARTEQPDGKTSPEELIAAALASCWAMAFSHGLHTKGHKSEQIDVTARCTLDRVEDGLKITKIHMTARGRVPGLDQATFQGLAQEQACPVKNALKDSVEITVDATLEE